MASDFVRNLLIEQRKRMVGGIMAHAEQSGWWPKMSRSEQLAFRDKVLASTGAYHDVVLDCVKAAVGDGAVINEEAMGLIRDLHDREVRRDRVG
jgi:hypothetical protein